MVASSLVETGDMEETSEKKVYDYKLEKLPPFADSWYFCGGSYADHECESILRRMKQLAYTGKRNDPRCHFRVVMSPDILKDEIGKEHKNQVVLFMTDP